VAFVYILKSGDEDLFKIGRTRRDVEARIRQLSTGNPHPLTVFDVIETDYDSDCETFLHGRLRAKRLAGDAREFFAISADELGEAISDAREFMEEFAPRQREAERLAKEESDGRVLQPGDAEWDTYRRLVEVRVAETALKLDRVRLETELKLAIGTAAGLERIATWRTQSTRTLDEARLKIAEPTLYESFLRESRSRVFRLR
jgi:hypothetical protein